MPISEKEISDEQLMLLEQLTYLSPDVAKAAGLGENYASINTSNGDTVGDFLSQFTEDTLNELETKGTILDSNGKSTFVQGNEWAAVIRALKNDSTLSHLQITNAYSNPDGKTVAVCFNDVNNPKQAVVAFRGTLDGDEWFDNVEGFNSTDTKAQREALEYIEGLPYNDITVVGHSKGGNKAQYVTLLSDRVNRCVAMDAQGGSKELIEKYWAEIGAKGNLIKNYSLNNDFVHILLFPIPGSKQLYFVGSGMESGFENHSPNSYFYVVDKDGHAELKMDGGKIYLNGVEEEYSSIAYLHGFVDYILNVMPDEDKKEIIPYLGGLLALTMGEKDYELNLNNVTYTKNDTIDFLRSDPEALSMLCAYMFKYIKTYELTEDQVYDLLEAFGCGYIAVSIKSQLTHLPALRWGYIGISNVAILLLGKIFGGIDLCTIEKEYSKIGDYDKRTATEDATVKTKKLMNFSKARYDILLSTIDSIESNVFSDVSYWSNYSSKEWYSSLGISVARSGINLYIDKLSDINSTCKSRIETVFSNEWEIDSAASKKITTLMDEINGSITGLGQLAERLAP